MTEKSNLNESFFPSTTKKLAQSLSFSGLQPINALEHVQNNFIKFSNFKIKAKNRENLTLKKIYNQKAYEYQLKKIKFESISSQIETSNTLLLAQEQTRQKLLGFQEKLREMCKKNNKIEAESSRYSQIIGSCFKNPARNDE